MAHYKAILAYDGSRFAGFQRQKEGSGKVSIQAVVEEALIKLGWQDDKLLFAGRTDAGVHATGQVIAFKMNWKHSPSELMNALNAILPQDIAVFGVDECVAHFHPRYQAIWRQYRYRVYCAPLRNPLMERYAWRIWQEPDLSKMQEGARLMLGEHDFRCFGTPLRKNGKTVRNVILAKWDVWTELDCRGYQFEIRANAFLYHMVRRIVAYLVEVGMGSLSIQDIERALHQQIALPHSRLAPSKGLTLIGVGYPQTQEGLM